MFNANSDSEISAIAGEDFFGVAIDVKIGIGENGLFDRIEILVTHAAFCNCFSRDW